MPVLNHYKIVYILIHTLYTIFYYLWRLSVFISKLAIRIIYSNFNHNDRPDQLQKRLFNLSKKPLHLTIILDLEEYSLYDLANLIFWCLTAGIPFISFYDDKGNLKKQEEHLQQIVNFNKLDNCNIIWHTQSGMQHKNGFTGHKIHVKILTEEDGRQCIVKLIRTFALSKEIDINTEIISDYLLKQYEFPDPDMALIFSKKFNISKYPPWQLRLTEFFKVDAIKNVNFSIFLKNLEKYSKCEQRVGK
ncbi:uncharacterized protein LOC130444169 [Diorhabda sublineata]|uniref:uncharacterized protein LOC130444169 n=1 Tax=Diorhabda sublineata TaxID=1163346 RepID=UPI0024E05056|nr:uncharacterized protein LOC130444169 [Diorhabda sublineata]